MILNGKDMTSSWICCWAVNEKVCYFLIKQLRHAMAFILLRRSFIMAKFMLIFIRFFGRRHGTIR